MYLVIHRAVPLIQAKHDVGILFPFECGACAYSPPPPRMPVSTPPILPPPFPPPTPPPPMSPCPSPPPYSPPLPPLPPSDPASTACRRIYGEGDCHEFDFCSGHGQCVDGLCQCDDNYIDSNCSMLVYCLFWDEGGLAWQTDGVTSVMSADRQRVSCVTEHLSEFAGIVVPPPSPPAWLKFETYREDVIAELLPPDQPFTSSAIVIGWCLLLIDLFTVLCLAFVSRHWAHAKCESISGPMRKACALAKGLLLGPIMMARRLCCLLLGPIIMARRLCCRCSIRRRIAPEPATPVPESTPGYQSIEEERTDTAVATDVIKVSTPTKDEPKPRLAVSSSTKEGLDEIFKNRRRSRRVQYVLDKLRNAHQFARTLPSRAVNLMVSRQDMAMGAQHFHLLVASPWLATLFGGMWGRQKAMLRTRMFTSFLHLVVTHHGLIGWICPEAMRGKEPRALPVAEAAHRFWTTRAAELCGTVAMLRLDPKLFTDDDEMAKLFLWSVVPALFAFPATLLTQAAFITARLGLPEFFFWLQDNLEEAFFALASRMRRCCQKLPDPAPVLDTAEDDGVPSTKEAVYRKLWTMDTAEHKEKAGDGACGTRRGNAAAIAAPEPTKVAKRLQFARPTLATPPTSPPTSPYSDRPLLSTTPPPRQRAPKRTTGIDSSTSVSSALVTKELTCSVSSSGLTLTTMVPGLGVTGASPVRTAWGSVTEGEKLRGTPLEGCRLVSLRRKPLPGIDYEIIYPLAPDPEQSAELVPLREQPKPKLKKEEKIKITKQALARKIRELEGEKTAPVNTRWRDRYKAGSSTSSTRRRRASARGIPPFCDNRPQITAWSVCFAMLIVYCLTSVGVAQQYTEQTAAIYAPQTAAAAARPAIIWAFACAWTLVIIEPAVALLTVCSVVAWDVANNTHASDVLATLLWVAGLCASVANVVGSMVAKCLRIIKRVCTFIFSYSAHMAQAEPSQASRRHKRNKTYDDVVDDI